MSIDKTEQFIRKAVALHGDRFSYDKVEYTTQGMDITIICPDHGEFNTTPRMHLRKSSTMGGCKKCAIDARRKGRADTVGTFIEKAHKSHDNYYTYLNCGYTKSANKVSITCPIHGVFIQKANTHIMGQGCPCCGNMRGGESVRMAHAEYITKVSELYNGRYDISKVVYTCMSDRIVVKCKIHGGEFTPTALSFSKNNECCPECSKEKHIAATRGRVISWNQFITDAAKTHDNKYTYGTTESFTLSDTITIRCPNHGEFFQTGVDHRSGRGCPKCAGVHKLTTDEFIRKAVSLHGDRFSYDKVEYTTAKTKVVIGCPVHGDFLQTPDAHARNGQGCPVCGKINRALSKCNRSGVKFVDTATVVHSGRYNYDQVNYIGAHDKVSIICVTHGEFEQSPTNHLSGQGCPKCAELSRIESKRDSLDEFIKKANDVHNTKYCYDKVIVGSPTEGVTIGCPIHGDFSKTRGAHLYGVGCPGCGIAAGIDKRRRTTEQFVEIAHEIHGTMYDYSLTDYITGHKLVQIICPIHGIFWQAPANHIHRNNPQGCPKCGIFSRSGPRITTEEFVASVSAIHDNKYDYTKTEYVGSHNDVTIICPDHGEFTQMATNHLSGKGCNRCAREKVARMASDTIDDFLTKARNAHGDFYDYSRVEFHGLSVDVTIICPTHGEFVQKPRNHVTGRGCRLCSIGISHGEREVVDFIKSVGIAVETSNRSIISPYELDIVIPDQKVAIEYCGNYWHSQLNGKSRKYHLNKLELAESQGYRLLTIFEDEWINHRDIVESRIRNILGKSERGVGARKLAIHEVDYPTARDFCNIHHIQGATTHMSLRYGAFHNDQLVALMTFNKSRRALGGDGSVYELVRFVTDGKSYAGVASRLLSAFRKTHSGDIISYADRRWSDGGLYRSLGFDQVGKSVPNYWYMHTSDYITRKHRYGFQKAKVVKQFDADPSMTEWEIMQANGYDRIWDCGNYKFLLVDS